MHRCGGGEVCVSAEVPGGARLHTEPGGVCEGDSMALRLQRGFSGTQLTEPCWNAAKWTVTWLEVTGQLAGTSFLQSGIRPCQCGVPGGGLSQGCGLGHGHGHLLTSVTVRRGLPLLLLGPCCGSLEPGSAVEVGKQKGASELMASLWREGSQPERLPFPLHCDGALACLRAWGTCCLFN